MARGEWQPINVKKALVAELKRAFSRDLDVIGLSLNDLINRLLFSAVEEAKASVSLDQVLQSLPTFTKEQLNEVLLVALYEMYVRPKLEESEFERKAESNANGQAVALICWTKLIQGESCAPQEIIKLAAFLQMDPLQLKQFIEGITSAVADQRDSLQPNSEEQPKGRGKDGKSKGV